MSKEKLKKDIWEQRIKKGITLVFWSAVGIVATVLTFGALGPEAISMETAILGSFALAYDMSNMEEGALELYYGCVGDINTTAVNPLRDTMFLRWQEGYDAFGLVSNIGFGYYSIRDLASVAGSAAGERIVGEESYSNFADAMSAEDRARYIANNEAKFHEEFSERAGMAGLNDTQIAEAYEAMRSGDYTKMASYFDTSSPGNGAVFWSGNKEGAAQYAQSMGGTIMEQTPGGQVFDNWKGLQGMYPEWGTGTAFDQKPIWEALSSQYANGAEGVATYIHPSGYEGKVWLNVEKPILEVNDIIIETNY